MTLLEPKTERDARGIDTLERALVYTALILRAGNTHLSNTSTVGGKINKYRNAVRIAANFANVAATKVEPLLSLFFKFPYDSAEALKQGGKFAEHVKSFTNEPVEILLQVEPTSGEALSLPSEPQWVNSLERYATWIASCLIVGHISLNPAKLPPVTIAFFEEDSDEPSITINATLKLDYNAFLLTNNLVAAVVQQIPVSQRVGTPDTAMSATGSFIAIGTP